MIARSKFRLDQPPRTAARAVLYVRVSSARQAETGVSLEDQRARLVAECARRGIADYVIAEDGGRTAKPGARRPGMEDALRRLASGERNLLLVVKLDRLARSIDDARSIARLSESQGWDIAVLDGTVRFDTTDPNGKLLLGMLMLLAEWERDMISVRTTEAMSAKRASGDAGLIPLETECRVVELYRSGLGMDAVARRLNGDGVATARGGRWYASTVKRVIDRATDGEPG